VAPGEFLGIVGESGCGKSTLLFAIAQLLTPPAGVSGGTVTFKGENLVGLTEKELAAVRWRDMSVVMQSAMNALNPVTTIAAQFRDAMRAHGVTSKPEIERRSAEALRMVGIDPAHLKSYPHQLSGGMRQRAMIAIIFVTHDMSLVRHFSDRLMVMYAGQIAELGATRQVFDTPRHPYSSGLLDAFPSIRGPKVQLLGIPGRPPDLARPPEGCRFAPRCPRVQDRCLQAPVPLFGIDDVLVRCLRARDEVSAHD
jgi:oligopeptide/dipeptide ABC transporter ATP-binding protein